MKIHTHRDLKEKYIKLTIKWNYKKNKKGGYNRN